MPNETNIEHTSLRSALRNFMQACPGCGAKDHNWSKVYTADDVVTHYENKKPQYKFTEPREVQDVYITYCRDYERYFLLNERKVLSENKTETKKGKMNPQSHSCNSISCSLNSTNHSFNSTNHPGTSQSHPGRSQSHSFNPTRLWLGSIPRPFNPTSPWLNATSHSFIQRVTRSIKPSVHSIQPSVREYRRAARGTRRAVREVEQFDINN